LTNLGVDSSATGSRFQASASPSLAHFVRDTAKEIPHPTEDGRTLWDARFDIGTLSGEHVDKEVLAMQEEIRVDDSLGVGALGSGSDYTVFLQHIGVCWIYFITDDRAKTKNRLQASKRYSRIR
jgi:N-acetylated-alpha-linked acidic dipeptidase